MAENTKDLVSKYLKAVSSKFAHKETSEMGYRTDFELLLNGIFESIKVQRIGHDERASHGNKPDFVVINNSVPILYIEVKDIGVSLDKVEKSEQMARYFGYTNLVLTDYLEFRFYRNGEPYEDPIKIAEYDLKTRLITPLPESYEHVAKSLIDFTQSQKEPIKSGEHLAKIMGGKAQRIRDNIKQYLSADSKQNVELLRVYETIKKLLVHDLSQDAFADMYAQTLVYGLFVARYSDETPDTFSRQEARDLVPASNPFLRHFFDHIAGPDYDKRLSYIVDELCMVFQHADVQQLMNQYFKVDLWGKEHISPDPVIHFYEDFLKEYDPELRKKMGAYYTPLPVVNFIVRSVDHVLQKEFGLPCGLADFSKLPNGKHRVQILDPAVGTGTFISATIRTIYERIVKQGQKGRWTTYVHNDLLPRLHGFEIMMTPYTIAHLKLSMAFKKTGFKIFNNRLGIYLTNSLEQSEAQQSMLSFGLAESIAEEAKQASKIKNDTPIMVVIGNPPYNVSSMNKGEWIQKLIADYKKGLNEKKINLDDDYIKFLRYAEHYIEKNKSGVVSMITNNSFIDGITHRQMRKHLLQTFDEIYIFNLHGDSQRDQAPSDCKEENVFDIQQGVAISIMVRKNEIKEKLGDIYYTESVGTRASKFLALDKAGMDKKNWKKLVFKEPYYFFAPKDFTEEIEYMKGFFLKDLFLQWSTGIETQNDEILLKFTDTDLSQSLNDMVNQRTNDYPFVKYLSVQGVEDDKVVRLMHKPFDFRYTYLDSKVLGRARLPFMNNLLKNNIALMCARQYTKNEKPGAFVVNMPAAHKCFSANDKTVLFPLYLYFDEVGKTPNLNKEIVNVIEKSVGRITNEDIFDYIYAVLHSPSYCRKYKEFLKIDFPRIPYPKYAKIFKRLVKLGAELRGLHLLESPKANKCITTFPVEGSDTVDKVAYKDGNVFVNEEQYFGKVPEIAWDSYIGGYQPAQKWLKDRKGRKLSNEDIEHYQKIIAALTETDRITKEIDEIDFIDN
jgi:predicted helicase